MGLRVAASLAHQLGGELVFASEKGCSVEAELKRLQGAGREVLRLKNSRIDRLGYSTVTDFARLRG